MPVEMPIDIPMHLAVERRGGCIEITPARSLPLRSWLAGWIAGAIVALAAHGVMYALGRSGMAAIPPILIGFAYVVGVLVGLAGAALSVWALRRNRRWAEAGPLVVIDPGAGAVTLRDPRAPDGAATTTAFSSLAGVHIRTWYHHDVQVSDARPRSRHTQVRRLEDLSLELRDAAGEKVMLPLLVNHRAGPSRKAAEALARELGVPLHATAAPRREMLFRPKGLEEQT